ncbi:hypothetical protein RI129_010763 [Pyrocoelia pectoralis]|uniref:UDP-glucuronosyltransferase n=1 Tax=Pyrocoelia pectoralis TaxID=417401 RepID=A0AAN7ZER5_9COLE
MPLLLEMLNDVVELQMQHPFVQNLITNQSVKFDVFLLELLVGPPIAFGKKFECPIIGLTTLRQSLETANHLIGTPTHPILYPDVLLPFEEPENLLQRVFSAIYALTAHLATVFYIHPQQNLAIEKYFGKGFGTVEQLTSNASLMFINGNPFLDRPRPTMPATIEIGGIHIVPPKPLPTNLKIVLDSASVGVIYFSLGTNVKTKLLSKQVKDILLSVFSELPYTILWKLEDEDLPNSPDNVIVSKWFPQSSVLKHPNTKLFITQGGLQSIDEAIYEGVPMVGMPFFADQPGNINKMVRKGFGLSFDIGSLEKEHFKQTILEVINNPKYGLNVKKASQLGRDKPMSGLEHAVWWVEYLIRHKGAKHLQSPLINISWWKYLLLDVIACLAIAITALCFVVFIGLRFAIWCYVTLIQRS